MESTFDHWVRTVSLKYRQKSYFRDALKEVIAYAKLLLNRYSKVHTINACVRIERHKCLPEWEEASESEWDENPMEAILEAMTIPRELKIRLEFAKKNFCPMERNGL